MRSLLNSKKGIELKTGKQTDDIIHNFLVLLESGKKTEKYAYCLLIDFLQHKEYWENFEQELADKIQEKVCLQKRPISRFPKSTQGPLTFLYVISKNLDLYDKHVKECKIDNSVKGTALKFSKFVRVKLIQLHNWMVHNSDKDFLPVKGYDQLEIQIRKLVEKCLFIDDFKIDQNKLDHFLHSIDQDDFEDYLFDEIISETVFSKFFFKFCDSNKFESFEAYSSTFFNALQDVELEGRYSQRALATQSLTDSFINENLDEDNDKFMQILKELETEELSVEENEELLDEEDLKEGARSTKRINRTEDRLTQQSRSACPQSYLIFILNKLKENQEWEMYLEFYIHLITSIPLDKIKNLKNKNHQAQLKELTLSFCIEDNSIIITYQIPQKAIHYDSPNIYKPGNEVQIIIPIPSFMLKWFQKTIVKKSPEFLFPNTKSFLNRLFTNEKYGDEFKKTLIFRKGQNKATAIEKATIALKLSNNFAPEAIVYSSAFYYLKSLIALRYTCVSSLHFNQKIHNLAETISGEELPFLCNRVKSKFWGSPKCLKIDKINSILASIYNDLISINSMKLKKAESKRYDFKKENDLFLFGIKLTESIPLALRYRSTEVVQRYRYNLKSYLSTSDKRTIREIEIGEVRSCLELSLGLELKKHYYVFRKNKETLPDEISQERYKELFLEIFEIEYKGPLVVNFIRHTIKSLLLESEAHWRTSHYVLNHLDYSEDPFLTEGLIPYNIFINQANKILNRLFPTPN